MSILATLLGGRPMHLLECSFIDRVNGKPVYKCVDQFGRYWLAQNRWSWFRIPTSRSISYPLAMRLE